MDPRFSSRQISFPSPAIVAFIIVGAEPAQPSVDNCDFASEEAVVIGKPRIKPIYRRPVLRLPDLNNSFRFVDGPKAADACLLNPELAAGIRRVKGVNQLGFRAGKWLSVGTYSVNSDCTFALTDPGAGQTRAGALNGGGNEWDMIVAAGHTASMSGNKQ